MIDPQDVLCVVPVRLESSRFPRKPLAEIKGVPLLGWVCARVKATGYPCAVATDSDELAAYAATLGVRTVRTRNEHLNGTERTREALETYSRQRGKDPRLVLNVQGDEPLILPSVIRFLAENFDPDFHQILTLESLKISRRETLVDPFDSFVVKDRFQKALYFSRFALPFHREGKTERTKSRHLGIYAYAPAVLREIAALPPSPLELAEGLEQNRWLENGKSVHVLEVARDVPAVDVEKHLAAVERFIDENPEYAL